MRLNLPDDMKKYERRKLILRWGSFVLLEAMLILILIFWGKEIFKVKKLFAHIICYGTVVFIPFFTMVLGKRYFDRSFCGEIINFKVKSGMDFDKRSMYGLYFKGDAIITIETPEGKRVKRSIRAQVFQTVFTRYLKNMDKLQQISEDYKVASHVFHLYGTPYVIHIPTAADELVQCAKCGARNEIKKGEKCRYCGYTLITKYSQVCEGFEAEEKDI